MTSEETIPRVTAVVLAYGAEPLLESAVRALLSSRGVDLDVVIVDNGCEDGSVERLEGTARVRIDHPGQNLGFAGGCNRGAILARGDLLAFVNADAVVDPMAISRLVAVAMNGEVGIASASLRLADEPELLNSAGNEIHFLGFSWCTGFGRPATEFADQRDVTSATGAAMVLRRDVWADLDGFESRYFVYHEDAELSIRCWQLGLRVVFVPDAVVTHRYEFSRNPPKMYYVERNRLITVLTTFERRTAWRLSPALVGTELGMAVIAARQGWGRQKLAGWSWLLRNRRWVGQRRRWVQARRKLPDAELMGLYSAHL